VLRPYYAEIRRLATNAFAAYGCSLLWVMSMLLWMTVLLGPVQLVGGTEPLSLSLQWMMAVPALRTILASSPIMMAFMGLVFAPLVEEAIFRMLPLAIMEKKSASQTRAVVVCVCGILFGILHGSPINVFIQGFTGLMLGFLYLKNGPNQLSSYLSCAAVHAAYNFTMLAIAAANG
jgi:membrane protease YdiL (CAAX protease family)